MSVDGNGLGGTVTGTCIEAKSVMTIPLSSLRDSTLDLATGATECRFRVVDCSSFIECNELRVLEFQDVPWKLGPNPPLSYATISYVWRGNPRPPGEDASSELPANFNVTGAEDGDPIGLDALHHACIVSMRYGISYIWLDRLCILQTSKVDKSWQIQRMAEIYRQTTLCIVLPGGITRLVSLDEPTTWIHRAWTLQESILPSQSLVLFAWGYAETAKVYSKSSSEWDCQIVPVVGGISATIPLTSLLHHHHSRNASIIHKGDQQQFSPKIFGSGNEGRMPAHALASAMQQDILDGHEQAIWRCALMRTSSRPVDMVFSIMGMFGVTLDPRSFKKDDRVGATIALAREILRRGGKANWLGGTLRITPSNELSWAPQFPLSAVDSLPRVEMQNGLRDVRDMLFAADYDSWIEGLPTGKVNEDGAFKFTTRAVSLVSTTHTWFFKPEPFHCAEAGELLVRAKDGSIWKIQDDALDATSQETFSEHVRRTKPGNLPPLKPANSAWQAPPSQSYSRAVMAFIGTVRLFRQARPTLRPRFLRAMLLVEYAPEQFHRFSYFELDDDTRSFIEAWSMREVCIGGLRPPSIDASQEPARHDMEAGFLHDRSWVLAVLVVLLPLAFGLFLAS